MPTSPISRRLAVQDLGSSRALGTYWKQETSRYLSMHL
jgi:hypothetical protein